MNEHNWWLRKIKNLALFLMMGLSMTANAGLFGFGAVTWKEEVLLHDGQKIIVERTAKRHGRHEIGQRPPIGDQSISFTLQGTHRQVEWKDEFSEDVGGANFNLIALDVAQGAAYLVVTPAGCFSYTKWGRPNPPYVIFKNQNKEWVRIPLQELPAEIKSPNMLHSSPDEFAEKRAKSGIVSAEVIRSENARFRQPEYRTILREAIPESALCPIPTNARAEPIGPVINGEILYYNWWPLAKDWLNKTNSKNKQLINGVGVIFQ